ncbi:MAG: hypothetical protein ABEJ75_00880, partial [Candidatus Nanohaloarchaea archaeon]
MPEEWHDLVIETGVDTLLNYLAENREDSVDSIAREIGVKPERVRKWADALEDEGLVEKDYTLSSGLVLRYTDENRREAEQRKSMLKQKIDEKSEEVSEKMEEKTSEVTNTKRELVRMIQHLDEQERTEEQIKRQIERLEDVEEKLEDRIENDDVDEEDIKLLGEVEETLSEIEEREPETNFEHERQKLAKQVKALEKLESHVETAKEEEETGVMDRIKEKIPFIGGRVKEREEPETAAETGDTSDEMQETGEPDTGLELSELTVKEAKSRIRDMEDPDHSALLEQEKSGKDRKTLKSFLESRVEEEEEPETSPGEETVEEPELGQETGEQEEASEKLEGIEGNIEELKESLGDGEDTGDSGEGSEDGDAGEQEESREESAGESNDSQEGEDQDDEEDEDSGSGSSGEEEDDEDAE